MNSQFATNRQIRRAYRKRLLPLAQQCLLGRALQVSIHHTRHSLDRQTASEILACFEGNTWISEASLTVEGLLAIYEDTVAHSTDGKVSIGKFVGNLYEEDVAYESEKNLGTPIEQHERLVHLLATLYVAGFLPEFNPDPIPELV